MSSKSNVVTTTDNHANQANIQGGLSAIQGDSNYTTINQLDGGAVAGAFDMGKASLQIAADTYDKLAGGLFSWAQQSQNAAADQIQRQYDYAAQTTGQVKSAFETATTGTSLNVNMIVVVLAVAGLAYAMWGKSHG